MGLVDITAPQDLMTRSPDAVSILTRPHPPKVRSHVPSTLAEGKTSLTNLIAASRSCVPPSQLGPNDTTNSSFDAALASAPSSSASFFRAAAAAYILCNLS